MTDMDAATVALGVGQLKNELEGLGVGRLFLVDSVARGQEVAESDLDFVVEFIGPPTFLRLMGLSELLERCFGMAVDLATVQ